jgi:hypothetical protein
MKVVLYWDETYVAEIPEVHGEEFFSDDNGDQQEDLHAIEHMNVGDSLKLDNGHHLILRVL